jgi:hypothetical protein
LAALPKLADPVTGAESPPISIRIPVTLNDPDAVLPGELGKPGKSISTRFRLVFSLKFAFVILANTPLAP